MEFFVARGIDDILSVENLAREALAESRFSRAQFSSEKFAKAAGVAAADLTRYGVLIARHNETPVGVCYVQIGEPLVGAGLLITTVQVLFVRPALRAGLLGGRVANGLLSGAMSWNEARGGEEVLVHVTSGVRARSTHHFLKRRGFETVGGVMLELADRKKFRHFLLGGIASLLVACSATGKSLGMPVDGRVVVATTVARYENRPLIFNRLTEVELRRADGFYRFVIEPFLVPAFKLYKGQDEDGTPVIAVWFSRGDGRKIFNVIRLEKTPNVQVKLATPQDWRGIVDSEPLAKLEKYREECARLPRRKAEQAYGYSAWVGSDGSLFSHSEGPEVNCDIAGFNRVLAVLAKTAEWKLLISDVNGNVFVQEIKE